MDYPTFDPGSPDHPLTEAELATLESTLDELPADGAMTLDGLDGYLTALLVGPPLLQRLKTADWLPAAWGGDPHPGTPAPFPSNQKKKRTTVLVLRHLRSILGTLQADAENWEPIFSVAEGPGEDGGELADAGDWCLGFMTAVDLDRAAWAPLFDDAALGPGLAKIALLGEAAPIGHDTEAPASAGDEGDTEDPVVRDRLSRALIEDALALWRRPR